MKKSNHRAHEYVDEDDTYSFKKFKDRASKREQKRMDRALKTNDLDLLLRTIET